MTFRNKNLITFAALFTSLTASAAPQVVKNFRVGDEKTSVNALIPEGWDSFVNLTNTPLALISPKGLQDLSSVIQIAPMGVKDAEDRLSEIKKDPDSYYSQKEDQVEAFDGDIISYLPLQETKKDGATIYSIGVKYKNNSGEFLDQTYYVSTKSKELFYIKALMPLDLEPKHNAIVGQVVNTISSKN